MNLETKLSITGMNCQHCVSAVRKALEGVPGVETVDVSLDQAQAVVSGSADADAMVTAVEDAGFDAVAL
jgi:copper chaperone CopZ